MLVLLDGWMVVRFVGVTRVPLCARLSCVRPVCVPAPPVSFYRLAILRRLSETFWDETCETVANLPPCILRASPRLLRNK